MSSVKNEHVDSIDIAGRGSLEAEAVAQAIAEATTKAMTEAKKVKISCAVSFFFLKYITVCPW